MSDDLRARIAPPLSFNFFSFAPAGNVSIKTSSVVSGSPTNISPNLSQPVVDICAAAASPLTRAALVVSSRRSSPRTSTIRRSARNGTVRAAASTSPGLKLRPSNSIVFDAAASSPSDARISRTDSSMPNSLSPWNTRINRKDPYVK